MHSIKPKKIKPKNRQLSTLGLAGAVFFSAFQSTIAQVHDPGGEYVQNESTQQKEYKLSQAHFTTEGEEMVRYENKSEQSVSNEMPKAIEDLFKKQKLMSGKLDEFKSHFSRVAGEDYNKALFAAKYVLLTGDTNTWNEITSETTIRDIQIKIKEVYLTNNLQHMFIENGFKDILPSIESLNSVPVSIINAEKYNEGLEFGIKFAHIMQYFMISGSYDELNYIISNLEQCAMYLNDSNYSKGFYDASKGVNKKYTRAAIDRIINFAKNTREFIFDLDAYSSLMNNPNYVFSADEKEVFLGRMRNYETSYGSAAFLFILERHYGLKNGETTGIDLLDNMITRMYGSVSDPRKTLDNYFSSGSKTNLDFTNTYDSAVTKARSSVSNFIDKKMKRTLDYQSTFSSVDIFAQYYLFCQKDKDGNTLYDDMIGRFGEHTTSIMQDLSILNTLSVTGQQAFLTDVFDPLSKVFPYFIYEVLQTMSGYDSQINGLSFPFKDETNRSLTVRNFYLNIPNAINTAGKNIIRNVMEDMYQGGMIDAYGQERDIETINSVSDEILRRIIELPSVSYADINIPFFPDIYETTRSSASPFLSLAQLFSPFGNEMISEVRERTDVMVNYMPNLIVLLEAIDYLVPVHPPIIEVTRRVTEGQASGSASGNREETFSRYAEGSVGQELAGPMGTRRKWALTANTNDEYTFEGTTRGDDWSGLMNSLYLDQAYLGVAWEGIEGTKSQGTMTDLDVWLKAYRPSSDTQDKVEFYEVCKYNKESNVWELYSFANTGDYGGKLYFIGKREFDFEETQNGYVRTWLGGIIDIKDVHNFENNENGFVFSALIPKSSLGAGGVVAKDETWGAATTISGEESEIIFRFSHLKNFEEAAATFIKNEKTLVEIATRFEGESGLAGRYVIKRDWGYSQGMTNLQIERIKERGGVGAEAYIEDINLYFIENINLYLNAGRIWGYQETWNSIGKFSWSKGFLQGSVTSESESATGHALASFGTFKASMPFVFDVFKQEFEKTNLEMLYSPDQVLLFNASFMADSETEQLIRSAGVSAGVLSETDELVLGGTAIMQSGDNKYFLGAGVMPGMAGITGGILTPEELLNGTLIAFVQGAWGINENDAAKIAAVLADRMNKGEIYLGVQYDRNVGSPVIRLLSPDTMPEYERQGALIGTKIYTLVGEGKKRGLLSVDLRTEYSRELKPEDIISIMSRLRVDYQRTNLSGYGEINYEWKRTGADWDKSWGISFGVTYWF
ncbi:hypothetical protein KO465_03790 [Candidatus Micrarchaeota archaeon]|nr:hypothetical protein [Candidatus Micrarchaeota archaeon]